MARDIPLRNPQKRLVRFGEHSNALQWVTNTFEVALGMTPDGTQTSVDWLRQLIGIFNKKKGTEIKYSHEDYGYWFSYSSLKDLEELEGVWRRG